MVGTLWLADIAIASASAILLVGILAVYLRNWRELHGRILLVASAFVFVLMAANIAAVYLCYVLAQSFGAAVAMPLLIIQVLQVIGYSIFFVLIWKY